MTTKFLNISTDGTLAGNSDSTVVSEKAIKTYVDGKTDSGLVHTTGDETIAGTKTFSSTIAGSISGNAATATALAESDTRSDNQNPKWYMDNYRKAIVTEFKSANKIGLTGNYYQLQTYVTWNDSSGGYPTQIAISSSDNTKIYKRVGTANTTWGDWKQLAFTDSTVAAATTATKATQDGNGATIATTYIPRSFHSNVAADAVAKAPEVYGTSSKPVGLFRNFNLLHAVENKFFGADKGVKTGTAATITCNYTVTNMFNGSYDGYNTSINPSTSFSSTPFVFEMKCPSSFEATDVCNLYLAGHRQTYQLNVTAYKLEVAYAYSSANGYSWGTLIDYSGSAINILNKHYGIYYAGHGGANSYHSVYGIRLTISGATSTVFTMSEIMLLSSRGTEKVTNALNTINTYDGGTVRGNITIPTANGSFVGNLDGTATKATKDGDGNTFSSSYLKLSGGTMTGAIKFASGSLTQNQTPQYYLAMDAFASGGEVKWTSVANARSGKDGDGNTISSTYIKASTKGAASGVASLDANTKIPAAQLPTMVGAGASTAGTAGAVPAPVAGANELFLRGDGTWAEPQGGGGGTGPSRNVGEIVPSTIPLTDAGLHLLDGAVISSGSYATFVSYISGLVSSHSELFVTESEWQQSITDYGVCGKFVYNSTNNTVRLPKITGIVEGTTDLTALGDLIEAGIPNHFHAWGYNNQDNGGSFSAANNPGITIDQPVCDGQTFGTRGWNGSGGGGSFTASDTYQDANMTTTVGVPSEGQNGTGTSGDAHGIMGNSETVQPQTIKILFYIVISNSTKTEIEVDIDEIATDLAAKVDRAELDEVQCIVETYNNGTSWYRVWSDGWCEQGGRTVTSSGSGFETVTLLKPYADTNYSLSVTNLSGASRGDYRGGSIVDTSTITVGYDNGQSSWETKGYI